MSKDSTPKLFVLQLGALLAMYVTISFLITLVFTIINLLIPDATDAGWSYESYLGTARLGIAVVLVFFPAYLVATWLVLKSRRGQDVSYVTPVRWLLYLSLLVAGAVLLGNLVSVIMAFLEGEVTLRFIFKVLAMFVVVGAALGYYALDVKDYWLSRPRALMLIAGGTLVAVLGVVTLGFYSILSPSEARERSLDARQVSDLQTISYSINNYIDREEELPAALEEVFPSANQIPTAPEDRASYEYRPGEDYSYELCATFSAPRQVDEYDHYTEPLRSGNSYVNWAHEAGEWCFEVDVELDQTSAPTTE